MFSPIKNTKGSLPSKSTANAWGFPGSAVVKKPLASAEDMGSICGLGRSPHDSGNEAHMPLTTKPVP